MKELIVSILFLLAKFNILKTDRFKLDFEPMAPIYWVNGEQIFINERNRALLYDVVEREIVEEYEKSENQLFGMYRDNLFICGWSNKEINSPDEFSTHLIIKENEEEIVDVELKPTVEVVECSKNPILRTIFPIEEKLFSFKDGLYEIDEHKTRKLSPNLKRVIDRDSLGNYWIISFNLF
jgi:hypothetical protein